MLKDKAVILDIKDIAHDGRGIGFIPSEKGRGQAVFIAGVLPGQRVKANIDSIRSNYLEASLEQIVTGEELFAKPICGYWQQCGGCPLQRMPYTAQLQWKANHITQTLRRIGGMDEAALQNAWQGIRPSPKITAFRNKARFGFTSSRGWPLPGYHKRQSNEVLPVCHCPLLPASAKPILDEWPNLLEHSFSGFSEIRDIFKSVTLRYASATPDAPPAWHCILNTEKSGAGLKRSMQDFGERQLLACPELAGFTWGLQSSPVHKFPAKRYVLNISKNGNLTDSPELHMRLGGRHFIIHPESFFQVNSFAGELLAKEIMKMDEAAAGSLLDMYCGVGAPGQLLGINHGQCLGIEQDSLSVRKAAKNAVQAGLAGFRYHAGDAGAILSSLPAAAKRWDTVLLDPPRAGVEKRTLKTILQIKPKHIIYISCNPATLARDSATLKNAYTLTKLSAVDMFPHTPHMECCSLWERN